jgi:hypothetical protein
MNNPNSLNSLLADMDETVEWIENSAENARSFSPKLIGQEHFARLGGGGKVLSFSQSHLEVGMV